MQQVNGLDLKSSDLRLDQIILKSEHSMETSAQKQWAASKVEIKCEITEISETKVISNQDRKEAQGAKQSVPGRRPGQDAE